MLRAAFVFSESSLGGRHPIGARALWTVLDLERNAFAAVEAIEVELQVVRTAGGEVSASGGLWQVLTVGGKATYSSAATHKIKLVLKPRKDGSLETLIGEESDRPA